VVRHVRKGEKRHYLPRSWRLRLAIAVALALVAGIAYYFGENFSVEQDVELAVSADQGEATVAIVADKKGVSPACGCQNPEAGKLNWTGLALPSEGFRLDVTAAEADNVPRGLWQLTALAPRVHVIDWYAAPYATLEMRVTVTRAGRRLRLFDDRTTFLQMIGVGPVEVEQDRRFPYAALLPAAGGETTAGSRSPVRPGEGGSLDIASSTPSRDMVHDISSWDIDVIQRGPMIDVLGSTTFRIKRAGNFQIYAGKQLIRGVLPTDEVTVRLQTPYSLRLFPSPAPRRWVEVQPTLWREEIADSDFPARARWEKRRGPALVGRNGIDFPLPQFAVHLSGLSVPDERTWSSFASRSAKRATIRRLIAADSHDSYIYGTFGLPPVPARPEVGVFGKVTRYESNAIRGELIADSETSRISNGENVSVDSSAGLDMGKYRFTPLISAGTPAEEATLAGQGKVEVDGDARTTLDWLSWVAGVIAVTLIGLAIGAIVSGVNQGRPK
jgi:hypothetical protein